MSDTDPAHLQEAGNASNATVPPVEENKEEVSEPESPETEESKPQDDEIHLTIEEEPKESAPNWVRDLREQHRDLKARNAELERKLKEREEPVALGIKPTLEGCDYDADRFERDLESWHAKRQEVARQEADASAAVESQRRAWNERLQVYAKAKEELTKQIPSFPEAEMAVQSMLDVTQQGVIVGAAENPAMVICALGQNPKLAQDLSKERDPIRFAFKIAKLEAKLVMGKKNNAPPPERPVKGTGGVSGTADSQLERLRAEAAKTGDYTKVLAYKQRKQQ